MGSLLLEELQYDTDSINLFEKLVDEPWSVFLDSCQPLGAQGRFDILVSRPKITIETQHKQTIVKTWSDTLVLNEDPFKVLKEFLPEPINNSQHLPFTGGALGYFSYDLGRYIEKVPSMANNDIDIPDMSIGIYPWAVVVDHQKKKSILVGDKSDIKTRRGWGDLCRFFSKSAKNRKRNKFKVNGDISSNMTEQNYAQAFDKVKNYILEGDCYQVNLAQRFNVGVEGDVWEAYQSLRAINASPFSAYMNYGDFQILSNSPERFISVLQDKVETKPIKGTRPRSSDPMKDEQLAKELKNSKKDQAENVMIVDLLRNDLSKNCALGSVKVPLLFDIESFPNVHHLVSTITGKLREKRTAVDIVKGSFPGGSITGAPKVRSMEIIEELEPHRRSIYCGAIGYISTNGNVDTNIAIRTIIHKNSKMYFYAGGGIVYDSQVEAEYQETFDKATAMTALLKQGEKYAVGH